MTTKVGQEARAYLAERGMTDQLLEEFNIGLAPKQAVFSTVKSVQRTNMTKSR